MGADQPRDGRDQAQRVSRQPLVRGISGATVHYIDTFLNSTGMTMFETDGGYGAYVCGATGHAHHHRAGDSLWMANQLQRLMYNRLRERGVYAYITHI